MPDQPNTPNASRISAMLQDLAAQKSNAPGQDTPPAPARPPTSSAGPVPPPNLPTSNPRPVPPPAPQRLPTAPQPTATPPPQPTTPPPPPREPAVSVVPIPKPAARPPAPPPANPPPAMFAPPSPQKAASADVSTEMRTMAADIGNLKVGQAPQGIRTVPAPVIPEAVRAKPLPPPVAAPETPPAIPTAPPVITPPPARSGGSVKKFIYAILAVLIVALIGYSLVSLMGSADTPPTASATPTPSASAAATPQNTTLASLFGTPTETLNLSEITSPEDLKSRLSGLTPAGGTGKNIGTMGELSFDAAFPEALREALGSDAALIVFGQRELFGSDGILLAGAAVEPRIIAVYEVRDVGAASRSMQSWESTTLADDHAPLFGYDPSRATTEGFSDGAYQQTPLRYRNFPYGDLSLDWAIVRASNQKYYLVMAGSKESMFFAIDRLLK